MTTLIFSTGGCPSYPFFPLKRAPGTIFCGQWQKNPSREVATKDHSSSKPWRGNPPDQKNQKWTLAKWTLRASQQNDSGSGKMLSGINFWKILVNLFLIKLVRILGFSSLFSAIAVFSSLWQNVLTMLRWLGKKEENPEILTNSMMKKVNKDYWFHYGIGPVWNWFLFPVIFRHCSSCRTDYWIQSESN